MAVIPLSRAREIWDKRIKALKASGDKSTLSASKFMSNTAKKLAPRSTGETIRGIRRRKIKNGWVVESLVRGRFKQNLFANQSAPYRTLRFSKSSRQPFYSTPQTVVYGKGARTAGGRSVTWTGTARFWHFSSLRTKERYRTMALKNTRKALRITT